MSLPRSLPMPDLSHAPLKSALRLEIAAVQRHFHEVVVPLWRGPGWNPVLALPYEALLEGRPLAPQRYRAMACARQLYLFASLIGTPEEADARAHAAQLFDSLQRHFHDPRHGGWFYSIDPQGQPLDRHKDLYSHAFVIFACAHYRSKVADARVDAALDQALDLLARHFADGDGLYHACLAEDWSDLGSGPLQNPLMHLAEALLVSLDLRPSPALAATLERLADGMQRRFVDPERSLVLEQPLGTADNWFEPGHQFEWFYLVESSPLLRGGALHASLQRAFEQVQRLGVIDGAVQARLAPSGQLLDGTRRIWAQAEYLRALTLRPNGEALVLQQLRTLRQEFLHPTGWTECREADGRPARHDTPSTTPYHLATCYAGLAAYLPGQ